MHKSAKELCSREKEGVVQQFSEEMATSGLRDQDRLDGASNHAILKARMPFHLDGHALKVYVDNVVVVPADADPLKKYKDEMAKAKRMILDGVKDHVASKGIVKEM